MRHDNVLLCGHCAQAVSYDEWNNDDKQTEATKEGLDRVSEVGYLSLYATDIDTFQKCHMCCLNDGEHLYALCEHTA